MCSTRNNEDCWIVNPLREFLLKLSSELELKDVKNLKFVAALPLGISEQCKDGVDVFEKLWMLGKIKEDNLECLKNLMGAIKRFDLIDIIGNN